ncbi:MAG: DUF1499 domain-containing protein [Aureliella sp.]
MMNSNSNPASELGVKGRQLGACPDSPNCVSTQAEDEGHRIDAIAFSGTAEEALSAVRKTLESMPRMKVVSEEGNYLHATATTLIMRYVDDVEFLFDETEGTLHFRSASRIGYSDLGANRKRMETFRQRFSDIIAE